MTTNRHFHEDRFGIVFLRKVRHKQTDKRRGLHNLLLGGGNACYPSIDALSRPT